MGIIDIFKNKKDEDVVLEPSNGGYTWKSDKGSSSISRAGVFFCATAPLKDEQEMLKGIIKGSGQASALAPGAVITVAYEELPGIDEFIATDEMPDSLNTFLMSRVMMAGLARGPQEMAKLAISPFNYRGVKGVLVLKEA
jgi:hypothetical protein